MPYLRVLAGFVLIATAIIPVKGEPTVALSKDKNAMHNEQPITDRGEDAPLSRAYWQLAHGHERSAHEQLRSLTQQFPKDPRAYVALGLCASQLNLMKESADSYRAALSLKSNDRTLHWRYAEVLCALDQPAAGVKELTITIQQNPKGAWPHELRAAAYEQQHDYRDAIADYGEWLRLNPGADRALYARAACYLKMKQPQKALEDYSELIRLYKDEDALRHRGDLYASLGEFSKAVDDYSEAIKSHPDDPSQFYLSRAQAYEKLDQKVLAAKDRAMAQKSMNTRLW